MLKRNLSISEQKREYGRGGKVSEVFCTLDDLLAEHSSASKLVKQAEFIWIG